MPVVQPGSFETHTAVRRNATSTYAPCYLPAFMCKSRHLLLRFSHKH